MLNKNTLGVKKVRGQSEAALQIGTVQLDYNFKKTRVRNYTRTTRTAKISWRVCECTRN